MVTSVLSSPLKEKWRMLLAFQGSKITEASPWHSMVMVNAWHLPINAIQANP
jgi:hypothetical protein